MSQNINRELVDHYKNELNEGIGYALGRAARGIKRGISAIGRVPGVKPTIKTGLVATAIGAGAYGASKLLTPSTPEIDVENAQNAPTNQILGKSVASPTTPIAPVKKKSSGSWSGSNIQPVETNTATSEFTMGRGFGGKPIIVKKSGGYVNPNSAEARVRADVASGKLPSSFGEYQGNRLPMDLAKEREDAGNAAFDKALNLPGASSMNRGDITKTIADRIKQRDAKDPVLQGMNKELADEQRANRIRATPEYTDAVKELQTAKNKSTIANNNDSSGALRHTSDAYAKWQTGGYHNYDNDPVSPTDVATFKTSINPNKNYPTSKPEDKPKYGVPELLTPNEAPKFNTSQEPQDSATKFAYDQQTNIRNTATKFATDQKTEADRIKDVASRMKTRFSDDANKSSAPVANAPLSLNPEEDRIKDVASNFAAQQRKQIEAGRQPAQPGRSSPPQRLYKP
jgi:hypothetical protein